VKLRRNSRRRRQAVRRQPLPLGRWLRGVAALGLLAGSAAGLVWAGEWVLAPGNLPLDRVELRGELRQLEATDIEQALLPLMAGGFFNTDVAALQAAAEAMPWVDRATVRRVWPRAVVVHLEEQRPAAHWNAAALLNQRGEVFQPAAAAALPLPHLSGPAGTEQAALQRYREWSGLLAPLQLEIAALSVDARRSWRLQLSAGMELRLGQEQAGQRLQRFTRAWASAWAADAAKVEAFDLRYSNGVAVAWKPAAVQQPETGMGS